MSTIVTLCAVSHDEEDSSRRWRQYRLDVERDWSGFAGDPVLAGLPSLTELAESNGSRTGLRFLLGPDGRPDVRINTFFSSPRMRSRSDLTVKKYAISVGIWLTFLDATGRRWWEATEDDVGEFKFWRMTDSRNPRRVTGGTVHGDLVAVSSFYEWAERRYGVSNPVTRHVIHRRDSAWGEQADEVGGYKAGPHIIRDCDVKWFDPAGYRRWRDLGLRGFGVDGVEVDSWRGRNAQRDCAFADGLYGTGLRLAEWGSVLAIELPADDPGRGFFTCRLAGACAKGARGRVYWMPRSVLADVLSYQEGGRASAVRRAQGKGLYEQLRGIRVVERVLRGGQLELVCPKTGERSVVSLEVLGPVPRRRLFRRTERGLEPVAMWLNEDGMPRDPHGWEKTFERANDRVAHAGLQGMQATPHKLRHSFALRWYSIGRLSYEVRFAHLTDDELRDFRAQFGDTWQLVRTLLGHADVKTTMDFYLEPFRSLDVSLLIEHIEGASMTALLAELMDRHPLVRTDPLRNAR